MRQKKAAVAVSAGHIRNEDRSDDDRRHAARTLELISGRRFHHIEKLEEAKTAQLAWAVNI
jgi:hypothetical protein